MHSVNDGEALEGWWAAQWKSYGRRVARHYAQRGFRSHCKAASYKTFFMIGPPLHTPYNPPISGSNGKCIAPFAPAPSLLDGNIPEATRRRAVAS